MSKLMSTVHSDALTQTIPRVRTADAKEPSDGPVLVKGWVRTVRKQKSLAFVEVNDGSNVGGIQCVVTFDGIEEETKNGTLYNAFGFGKGKTLVCLNTAKVIPLSRPLKSWTK